MLEDWQHRGNEREVMALVMEIRARTRQLLDLPVLPDHQESLRHLDAAAQALMALLAPDDTLQTVVDTDRGDPVDLDDGSEPDAASVSATPSAHPLHLLLVEDNPLTQRLMSRLLASRNHRVTLANHGQEALVLIQEGRFQADPFDLVLMDIRMPVMDGFETTLAIRQWEAEIHAEVASGNAPLGICHRRLPIMAVSALTGAEDRRRAAQVGMDGFHGKPVQANQLFADMERLVPHSSPVAEAGEPSPPMASATTAEAPLEITLDMGSLLKTVENDYGLLEEIVVLYRMDAPKQLQRIRDGIDRQDADLVREAAHSLKGASGAFGNTPTYTLAFQLEQAGRHRDLSQADALLVQLHRSIAALERALDAELSKNDHKQ